MKGRAGRSLVTAALASVILLTGVLIPRLLLTVQERELLGQGNRYVEDGSWSVSTMLYTNN